MKRPRPRFGYLLSFMIILTAFGVGIAVLFEGGRTERTHFDPVMP
jgi:hypothetical protein